jgi:hypothetical protein
MGTQRSSGQLSAGKGCCCAGIGPDRCIDVKQSKSAPVPGGWADSRSPKTSSFYWGLQLWGWSVCH